MTNPRRRPAFNPDRLEGALDALLPPLDEIPITLEPTQPPVAPAEPSTPTTLTPPRRPPRGSAGRPVGSTASAPGPKAVNVRVPKPLYDELVLNVLGQLVERPSYAQVVAWTCEDRPAEVAAELRHALHTASRQLRGRRLATEGVPLSMRFRPDEYMALAEVIAQVETDTVPVTRTAAILAAIRIAVKHGLPALEGEHSATG